MKLSAILAPLVAAKADHKTIMDVVLAFEAEQENALEKRREADRERQARKREKDALSRDVTLRHSDRSLTCGGDARGLDNLQPKKISGEDKKEETRAAAPRGDLADFRSELSSILDPERIEALVAVRRKKGATMTANTGRLLVAAIQRCHLPPAEVADEMALRHWTSVKPDWLESKSSPARNSADPPPRKQTVGQQARDELKRMGLFDAPDQFTRLEDESDRSPGFAGTGIARRIALAASGRGGH